MASSSYHVVFVLSLNWHVLEMLQKRIERWRKSSWDSFKSCAKRECERNLGHATHSHFLREKRAKLPQEHLKKGPQIWQKRACWHSLINCLLAFSNIFYTLMMMPQCASNSLVINSAENAFIAEMPHCAKNWEGNQFCLENFKLVCGKKVLQKGGLFLTTGRSWISHFIHAPSAFWNN